MKRQVRSYIIKSLLLASVLMLMVLLCGCRTRITNNTEVANVISDGSGWLQETYQVRRDELGIPIAEAPLFKGSSSDDEDYDIDEDYEDFDREEDEDLDEDEDEDLDEEDERDDDRTSQTRPSTTTRPATRTTTRPVTRPATRPTNRVVKRPSVTQTTAIRVTLNLNCTDAKCSKSSVTVKKGSTYGTLPTPTRDGYDFDGWYTAKTGGNVVTSDTKITAERAHTLYAHWTETEKPKYKITFDGNGEGDDVTLSSSDMTIEEGGTYGDMPSAKRDKYKFSGWFTDPTDGSQITSGNKFTANEDQTLYAHWEFDPYTWWDNEYSVTFNDLDKDSAPDCVVDEGDDTEKKVVTDCGGRIADSETTPAYVVKFIKNFDDEKAAQEAEAVYEKYAETAPDVKVVIVSDMALKGSKEEKLVYKMMLLEILYGNGGNIDEAVADLLDEGVTVYYPYVYSVELGG